jgi:hypothetical protein
MYGDMTRGQLIRQAWKAVGAGRFSDRALIEATVLLGDEPSRPKLRQALPAAWLHLDDAGEVADWLTATGLDGEAIDAMQSAIGAGLPERGKKAGLHSYALRPDDFPALLLLAFIAARLATPYVDDGSHRKVRAQFWYAPELAIILMRCLPPKLDLLAVEHTLRIILGPPVEWERISGTAGIPLPIFPPGAIGEPDVHDYLTNDTMGMIQPPKEDGKDA